MNSIATLALKIFFNYPFFFYPFIFLLRLFKQISSKYLKLQLHWISFHPSFSLSSCPLDANFFLYCKHHTTLVVQPLVSVVIPLPIDNTYLLPSPSGEASGHEEGACGRGG